MIEGFLGRRAPTVLVAAACAGLAAANWVRAPLLAAVAVALAVPLVPARLRFAALAAAVFAAGLAAGSQRVAALEHSTLAARAGEAGRARVVVTGPVRRSPYRLRAPAVALRFRAADVSEPVQLELPVGRSPPQGALLDLAVTVREPRTGDAGFDEREWLARRGVHVVLRGGDWRIVGRRGGLAGVGDRLRAHVGRTLAPARGERRAVLAGIALGADEGLSPELQDAFRASGLYHLLAVSGQNVALLAGGVLGAVWLVGGPRVLGHVAALLAIAAYVLIVGWQPSVVRAGVAGALVSLAWLAARPRDPWHFLLVGALVLLAWSPHALLEPGFQLSFAAVVAIFLALPRIERLAAGYPVPRPLAFVVGVSTACSLATAPIVWLHFGAVPLWSVAANALAAPVAAPLLGLALAAAAVAPVLPSAALALVWLDARLAEYLIWIARTVGGLPFAELRSGAALAGLALLALGLALRRRATLAALALLAPLALAWLLWPQPTYPPPQGVRVVVLDVGQGDAILLQTRAGAVLVDQGPPEARVARRLRRYGVRRLALLVLTHPQRDHVGGAAEVLAALPVDRVLDPGLPSDSADQRRALEVARRKGVEVTVARAGDAYRLGRLLLRVLWPAGPGPPGEDPNLRAVVVHAAYGAFDALLTADAESDVTGRLALPQVELLKVAHHGSADPGLPRLLRRLRPALAVVSAGAGNDYGHPAPTTLAALAGVATYRTDRHGDVVVESDGRRMTVRADR